MNRPRLRPRRPSRRGFTLLEVILALTILALALTILGELVSLGSRSAASARDLTRAQLLCESKLAELTSGVVAVAPLQQVELEMDPDWLYTVDVQPVASSGLVALTITVEQHVESRRHAAMYSLTRWIPDPDIEWPETFEELYETTTTQ